MRERERQRTIVEIGWRKEVRKNVRDVKLAYEKRHPRDSR